MSEQFPNPDKNSLELEQLTKDIKNVFELNPQLATIGSEQQYAVYLKTIFPNTKILHLGYKGVGDDFTADNDYPSFFTYNFDAAQYYSTMQKSTKVISALFNFQNPLIVDAEKPAPITLREADGSILGNFSENGINEKIQNAGYDGLILHRKFGEPLDGWEVLSFNSSSRHILGSDEDLKNFEEFTRK